MPIIIREAKVKMKSAKNASVGLGIGNSILFGLHFAAFCGLFFI